MPEKPIILYLVIPCYNEEKVLPLTSVQFLKELEALIAEGKISDSSQILFVDDGSRDDTWEIITILSRQDPHFIGISQSRNRGHQNALLAGLMEAKESCDAAISMDCDGQDDIHAIRAMLQEYQNGSDVVYGVRSSRKKDSFFKRFTAEGFYKLMNHMGCEVTFNHADYRLASARVLEELSNYKEVNIFLRGMFPLVGFKSSCVYYEREERQAGKTHYPLSRMVGLAVDGITSLTTYPIHLITGIGIVVSALSICGILWAIAMRLFGHTVDGWTSIVCMVCFLSGIELFALGIIGEYVGKTYMETKARPRYIIRARTWENANSSANGRAANSESSRYTGADTESGFVRADTDYVQIKEPEETEACHQENPTRNKKRNVYLEMQAEKSHRGKAS